jgi:hypothetical protein
MHLYFALDAKTHKKVYYTLKVGLSQEPNSSLADNQGILHF